MKIYNRCGTINNVSQKIKRIGILWCFAVFLTGGLYYAMLEILWRGYSHWTMVLVGGAAVLCMYVVFDPKRRAPLLLKCAASATAVCVLEFISGCIINILFGMDVWDYSNLRFNLLGQICPMFFGIWFVLSIPAAYVCRIVHLLENDYVSEVLRREQ